MREQRTMSGWPWAKLVVGSWLRRNAATAALPVAAVFSLPFERYIGYQSSHWLDGAWATSAVLLGFGVALMILVLQLAAGQSLRAAPTFRALMRSSGVAWPVAFALVFIAWIGALELASRMKHTVPRGIDIYFLAYFIAQVALFGLVFRRTVKLVAPAAVLAVMRREQADSIRRSVEEGIRCSTAADLVAARLEAAGVSTAFLPNGQPVRAHRSGTLDDVDLWLPRELPRGGGAGATELFARIGQPIRAQATFARTTKEADPLLDRALQQAVFIRRRPRVANDWTAIFKEAVDLARQALVTGGRSDEAFSVILAGLLELPRAHRIYGVDYSAATVGDPLERGPLYAALEELMRLSYGAFESGVSTTVHELPRLAYDLVTAGIDEDAPFLVDQGTRLWLAQVIDARRAIPAAPLRDSVIESVSTLARAVFWKLWTELRKESLDSPDRRNLTDAFLQLLDFAMHLLKLHIDAKDTAAFEAVWERSGEWTRRWRPDRNQTLRAELVKAHDFKRLKLGVWLLYRHLNGSVDAATWERLHPLLTAGAPRFDVVVGVLEDVFSLGGGFNELAAWANSARTIRVMTAEYDGRIQPSARLWATLLLLRGFGSAPQPPLDFMSSYVGPALLTQLDAIELQPERWENIVGEPVRERVADFRAAVEEAVERDSRIREKRVAAASISSTKAARFAGLQWAAFLQANPLRRLLEDVGALEVEVTPSAFTGPAYLWGGGGVLEGVVRQLLGLGCR